MNWTLGDIVKAVLAALVIVVIGSAFYHALTAEQSGPPPTDSHGCLKNAPVEQATLILVDNTDPFSKSQVEKFNEVFDDFYASMRPWELVAFGQIRDLPPKLYDHCRPVDGRPPTLAESFNKPNENWRVLRADFQRSFSGPLKDQRSKLRFYDTISVSPIFQTIEETTKELGTHWSEAKHRRLIIFSDMMENIKPTYTQYNLKAIATSFEETADKVPYLKDHIDLHDTDVEIYYLEIARDKPYQGAAHEKFWRDLITHNGGTITKWVPVPIGADDDLTK